MKVTRFATTALAFLLASGTGAAFAQSYGAPPPQGYGQNGYGRDSDRGQQGGWNNVPREFREAQQRGFRDGVDGARKDFENHRAPNVNNRDEFRHPNFIPRPDRRDYKFGFSRGYDVAVQHIYGHDHDGDHDRDHDRANGYSPARR